MNDLNMGFEDRLDIAERYRLIDRYGENGMDLATLERIAGMGPLVEFGAGSGYTARLLRDVGADILATDPEPRQETWSPVLPGTYQTTELAGRVALLVWPYMAAPTAWLRSSNAPDRLLVVNDVEPPNLRRVGGSYNPYLADNWVRVESLPIKSGWRFYIDYLHIWDRPKRSMWL
jgi:hypothetical protein